MWGWLKYPALARPLDARQISGANTSFALVKMTSLRTLNDRNMTNGPAVIMGLSAEILYELEEARNKVSDLNAVLLTTFRRVALPRAIEIGQDLARIKDKFPKGKRGAESPFYVACEEYVGLKKAQVCNYIDLYTNRHRLSDYLESRPDGAPNPNSMSEALTILRKLKRGIDPAEEPTPKLKGTSCEGFEDENLSTPTGTSYARSSKERLFSGFSGLLACPRIAEVFGDRIREAQAVSEALLADIEKFEAGESFPEPVEETTWAELEEVVVEVEAMAEPLGEPSERSSEEPPESVGGASLEELYPATADGLRALEEDIREAKGKAALGKELGLQVKRPGDAVAKHLKRLQSACSVAV